MHSILMVLLPALILAESGGRDDAVGDGGRAVGCLQITEDRVAEMNREVGWDCYTLEERDSRLMSVRMCIRYLERNGERYRVETGRKPTREVLARIWKGGPHGYKDPATEAYWLKVKRIILIRNRLGRMRSLEKRMPYKERPLRRALWRIKIK